MSVSHRDRVILVTGATSGIGRATALKLARRGHVVFATGRNAEALAELGEVAAAEELRLIALRLDVTSAASIEAALNVVLAETKGRGLDVLINNAGYGVVAPALEVTPEDLRGQFETNVFGLLAVTRAFVRTMQARGRGTIVNVGSVGGRVTLPLLSSYNATKYALECLSDGLRAELRPFGVRVAIIEPGVVDTNFNDCAIQRIERYKEASEGYATPLAKMQETMGRTTPLAASAQRVAKAIVRVAEARRPWARTIVPLSNLALIVLAKLLPTAWVDAILCAAAGLTRANVSPPPVAASEAVGGHCAPRPLTEVAAE